MDYWVYIIKLTINIFFYDAPVNSLTYEEGLIISSDTIGCFAQAGRISDTKFGWIFIT